MRPGSRLGKIGLAALCALTLSPLGPAGCGRDEAATPAPATLAADAEWRWLQATRETLEQKRAELARAETAAGSRTAARDAPRQDAARLRHEVETLSAELRRRLVGFLNADPPVEGRPMTPRQREALRMKSDEEILVAREFIQRGGDYRRAIEIYEAALAVDPANPRLRQELASARGMRYMSRERFARAHEGMAPDEVRAVLGQPNLHNVRDYTDRKVTAWFYPKGPDGAAAAVWFESSGGGARVYELDFDAVPPAPQATPPRAGQPPARPARPRPPVSPPDSPDSPGLTSGTD